MKGTKFSFKKLFGINSSDKNPVPKALRDKGHASTLEKLREMENLLQRKQEFLEEKINAQVAEARKQGTKNKRAALNALRRKKRYELELSRLDGTLTTIELQRESLEAAKNNVQILGAMKDAANVLKKAHKDVSIDKVNDIMDDINEQQDVAKEIADALANPLGRMDSLVDEDDLEKELEELEQEELNKALLDVYGTAGNGGSSVDNNDDGHDDATEDRMALTTPTLSKQKDSRKVTAEKPAERDLDESELKDLQELAEWTG